MLKAVMQTEQRGMMLVLGLSEMNLQRLREDQPIHIKREQLHDPNLPEDAQLGFDILIFAGKDEDSLSQDFMRLVSPTKMNVEDHRG